MEDTMGSALERLISSFFTRRTDEASRGYQTDFSINASQSVIDDGSISDGVKKVWEKSRGNENVVRETRIGDINAFLKVKVDIS